VEVRAIAESGSFRVAVAFTLPYSPEGCFVRVTVACIELARMIEACWNG